jgi:hypothetical protein
VEEEVERCLIGTISILQNENVQEISCVTM